MKTLTAQSCIHIFHHWSSTGQWKAFLGKWYPGISLGNKLSFPHSPSPLISFKSEGCWVLLGPLLSSQPVICSPRARLLFPFFFQALRDRVTLDGVVCQVTAPVAVTRFPFSAKSIHGKIFPSSLWKKPKTKKTTKKMARGFVCAKAGKDTCCICVCAYWCTRPYLWARRKENLKEKGRKVVKSGYLENTFPTLVPLVTTFQASRHPDSKVLLFSSIPLTA